MTTWWKSRVRCPDCGVLVSISAEGCFCLNEDCERVWIPNPYMAELDTAQTYSDLATDTRWDDDVMVPSVELYLRNTAILDLLARLAALAELSDLADREREAARDAQHAAEAQAERLRDALGNIVAVYAPYNDAHRIAAAALSAVPPPERQEP